MAGSESCWSSPELQRRPRATQIGCPHAPRPPLTAVASRSHNSPETEAFLTEKGMT